MGFWDGYGSPESRSTPKANSPQLVPQQVKRKAPARTKSNFWGTYNDDVKESQLNEPARVADATPVRTNASPQAAPVKQPNFWERLAGAVKPISQGGINPFADASQFVEKNVVKPTVDTAVKAGKTVALPFAAGAAAVTGQNKKPEVQQALYELLKGGFVSPEIAKGKASPLQFAQGISQAGTDVASVLPVGNGIKGLQGASKATQIGKIAASNAKQAAVLGTASTANDLAQGRGVSGGSLAQNYALPFALGSVAEVGGNVLGKAGTKNIDQGSAGKTATIGLDAVTKPVVKSEKAANNGIVHHTLADTKVELDRMDLDRAIQNDLKAPGADIPAIEQRLVERGMTPDEAKTRVHEVANMSRLDIRDGAPTKLENDKSVPLESLAGGPNTAAASVDELRSATKQLGEQLTKGLKGRENAVMIKENKHQRLYAYTDNTGESHTFTLYRNPDDTWSKPWSNPAPIKNSEDMKNSMRLLDDAQMNKEVERATADGNTRQYIWSEADNGATKTLTEGRKDPATPRAMQYDPERHYIAGGFVRNKDDDQMLGNLVQVGPDGIEVQIGRHFVTFDMDFSKLRDGKGGLKQIGRSQGGNNTFNQTERWIEAVTKDKSEQKKLRNFLVYPTRDAEASMKVEGRAMGEGINKWEKAFKGVPRKQGSVKDMMRDAVYVIEPDQKKVRDLGSSRAKKEALDAFKETYGDEAAAMLKKYQSWLREAYDNMLARMNAVRRQFGMEEIEGRPDYLTHSQEVGGDLSQLYQSMKDSIFGDIEGAGRRDSLPANISGLSDTFKPIAKYNQFTKNREADLKPLNPFDPLRRYTAVTLHNIHMTAPAARTRSLEQALRSSTDYINDIPKDLKSDAAEELTARLGGDHADMVNWLTEHANILSGKTPDWDRLALKSKGGRASLKAIRWAQKQAGMANILGNLGSAVNQSLALPFVVGTNGAQATARGIMRSLGDASANAAWRQSSGFIERYTDASILGRRGKLDPVYKAMGVPLKTIERATYHIAWNGSYEKALSKGLTGAAARREADTITTKIIPSRSIGDTAHVYNNTLANAPLQFTREQTEAWKNFTKDMSPYGKALTLASIFAMNAAIEATTGRAPLADPIKAVADTAGDVASGEGDPLQIGGRALQRGAETVASAVPVISAAANNMPDDTRQLLFGKDSDLGRYDGSMALTNIPNNATRVVNDLLKRDGDGKLTPDLKAAGQDAAAMLPGGAQIRKTAQAIDSNNKGFVESSTGRVQATVDKSNPLEALQSLIFGKNATPGKREANKSGLSLGDTESSIFRELQKSDPKKAKSFFDNSIKTKTDPLHTMTTQDQNLTSTLRNLKDLKLGVMPTTADKKSYKKRELSGTEIFDLTSASDKRTIDIWNKLAKSGKFAALSPERQSKALAAARDDAWAVERYSFGQKAKLNDEKAWRSLSMAQRKLYNTGSYQDFVQKVVQKTK